MQVLATPLSRQSVLAYPQTSLAALAWLDQRGLTPADLQPTANSAAEQSVASLLNSSREDLRASMNLLEHYRRKKDREQEQRGREQSARDLLAQYAAAGARRLGASDELIVEPTSGRQYLATDAGRPAVVRTEKDLADGARTKGVRVQVLYSIMAIIVKNKTALCYSYSYSCNLYDAYRQRGQASAAARELN